MPADPTPPAPNPKPPGARPLAPRLPGTYASNFERDADWQRGVVMLGVIFALMALCELVNTAWFYLDGGVVTLIPVGALHAVVEGALFLALWMGWNWARWSLAAVNFLNAGWLVVWLFALHAEAASSAAAAGEPAPGYGIGSIPVLATAMVGLASAGYLAFSADVLDFLRHRREQGPGRIIAALAVAVGGYMALILAAPFIYVAWLGLEETSARDYTLQSLREMSSPWNADTYERLADPDYLATWYRGDRVKTFARLSPLGEFRQSEQWRVNGVTRWDTEHGGLLVTLNCDLDQAQFAHGRAHFHATISKHLFEPWKMGDFQVDNPQMDKASAP